MEEQIRNFEWAQDKINELTASNKQERREAQLAAEARWPSENRKQRRERERQERRDAKKVKA